MYRRNGQYAPEITLNFRDDYQPIAKPEPQKQAEVQGRAYWEQRMLELQAQLAYAIKQVILSNKEEAVAQIPTPTTPTKPAVV